MTTILSAIPVIIFLAILVGIGKLADTFFQYQASLNKERMLEKRRAISKTRKSFAEQEREVVIYDSELSKNGHGAPNLNKSDWDDFIP